VRTRAIGEVRVSAIGLGAMPMSVRGHMPDEAQSIRTIHAALDAGITLIDSADAYTPDHTDMGHNERLVAMAVGQWDGDRDSVLVATKGGHLRTPGGGWAVDGRPEYIKAACERSLKALGVEAIGLYQHHRPDPAVPYADTVGALRDLLDAGKIRLAGISNADPAQIRLANDILGGRLAGVQNQFSPRVRTSEPELELCAELGIAFLPWSPLGGISRAGSLGGEHAAFAELAAARGVSPHQVCLAWELAKAPNVIPIPGASRPESIIDSARAADLGLTQEELDTL
jgi:aryl-alcohol dehydrogenase-like predicted oxidoreductase